MTVSLSHDNLPENSGLLHLSASCPLAFRPLAFELALSPDQKQKILKLNFGGAQHIYPLFNQPQASHNNKEPHYVTQFTQSMIHT